MADPRNGTWADQAGEDSQGAAQVRFAPPEHDEGLVEASWATPLPPAGARIHVL